LYLHKHEVVQRCLVRHHGGPTKVGVELEDLVYLLLAQRTPVLGAVHFSHRVVEVVALADLAPTGAAQRISDEDKV
jgi:hypothetical protein